jgi:hypothetical protein
MEDKYSCAALATNAVKEESKEYRNCLLLPVTMKEIA